MKTIAQTMKEVLEANNVSCAAWGFPDELDRCAELLGEKYIKMHPLKRHKRILDALEKSPLFTKRYIRLHRLCRCFWLKGKEPKRPHRQRSRNEAHHSPGHERGTGGN